MVSVRKVKRTFVKIIIAMKTRGLAKAPMRTLPTQDSMFKSSVGHAIIMS